jgi:hypothetical protein
MAVAIGGANGLIDRLLELVDYKATSTTSDDERVTCLNAVNVCEQLIAQSESLMYLMHETTLTLATARDYVAVPTNPPVDFGKEIVLGVPGGEGVIEYRPPDKFVAIRISTAYAISSDPSYYTIVVDQNTSERRFRFKPANSSGSTMTIPFWYQRVPPALTDAGSSYSSLPEGYELTLLLPMAAEYLKSNRNEFGVEKLSAALAAQLEEFYGKQRANKERATSDRSRERRKVDVTVAEEGY